MGHRLGCQVHPHPRRAPDIAWGPDTRCRPLICNPQLFIVDARSAASYEHAGYQQIVDYVQSGALQVRLRAPLSPGTRAPVLLTPISEWNFRRGAPGVAP